MDPIRGAHDPVSNSASLLRTVSVERHAPPLDDPTLDISCPQCAGMCRVLYDAGGPYAPDRHHRYDCPHCGRENGLHLAAYVIRVVKAED